MNRHSFHLIPFLVLTLVVNAQSFGSSWHRDCRIECSGRRKEMETAATSVRSHAWVMEREQKSKDYQLGQVSPRRKTNSFAQQSFSHFFELYRQVN